MTAGLASNDVLCLHLIGKLLPGRMCEDVRFISQQILGHYIVDYDESDATWPNIRAD